MVNCMKVDGWIFTPFQDLEVVFATINTHYDII